VDRDKAANVIATGKILRMNASSVVKIARAMQVFGPSFGLSASLASPPCGEWRGSCVTAANLTEPLGPRKAANSRSVKRPGKTGGSLTEAKCWAVRFPAGEGPPSTYRAK
jgi:hypothetical protein